VALMCGIAGIVAPDPSSHAKALEAMVASLRHRGPDESGMRLLEGCALGHARLRIVDLSTGQQPMRSARAPLTVTFNGEIYGYQELRRSLGAYPFRTASDTEVILALYEEHGPAMLERLPGMFAFALWDERTRTLFAARDRFGEKPLYYALGRGGELVFASEIKAILASRLLTPRLSRDGVAHYLQHLYVHPHRTIYENVHVLPPAHRLSLRDGRLAVERYWEPPPVRADVGMAEAVEELRRLLDRAVARQLVADVPVGAFLSGGLDSSTIVAVASRHSPRLLTFSFGFGDTINELPYARRVAERYDTDHRELLPGKTDLADLLLTMQEIYDEPFGDSSNIPTYLLARLAREHVTVALSGDGADELLAGYVGWYRPLAERIAGRDPHGGAPLLRRAAAWARRLGGGRSGPGGPPAEGTGTPFSVFDAHRRQNLYFDDQTLVTLGLGRAGKEPLGPERYPGGGLGEALRMDLEDYMAGDILVKTDRATMAHGLELRAPFLDRDLAVFCLSLPDALKIGNGEGKRLLRAGFEETWPRPVRRRRKQGFGAPVEEWLRLPSIRALRRRTLDDPRHPLYALLPHAPLRPFAERGDYRTWALLVLALWLERHPCGPPGESRRG
jgi:asparagine synthase (glutamine-hydrolysing)